jgi:hypothetical protein
MTYYGMIPTKHITFCINVREKDNKKVVSLQTLINNTSKVKIPTWKVNGKHEVFHVDLILIKMTFDTRENYSSMLVYVTEIPYGRKQKKIRERKTSIYICIRAHIEYSLTIYI